MQIYSENFPPPRGTKWIHSHSHPRSLSKLKPEEALNNAPRSIWIERRRAREIRIQWKDDVMMLEIYLSESLDYFRFFFAQRAFRLVFEGIWIKVNLSARFASFPPYFYFPPSIFQSLSLSARRRGKRRKALHPWSLLLNKINCLPNGIDGREKSAAEASLLFVCLNKIKLNHFVIISMMKHSGSYWITAQAGWKVKSGGRKSPDKWVRNKVEFISPSCVAPSVHRRPRTACGCDVL